MKNLEVGKHGVATVNNCVGKERSFLLHLKKGSEEKDKVIK